MLVSKRLIPVMFALGACGGPPASSSTPPPSAGAEAPAAAAPAQATPSEGHAPAFTLPDLDGNSVSLSQFAGKTVVLEWFNPGCPFVVYAHEKGPLATMAREVTATGVVWLTINSGAEGKQGHDVALNARAKTEWAMTTPILRDVNGEVGKLYQAKTTPTLVVISNDGQIAYQGALDNAPLGRAPESGQVNYVKAALADLSDGKPVTTPSQKSYGCSVKY